MQKSQLGGYAGQILRVDLTSQQLSSMTVDEGTLRQYIGGTGIGIKILYDELSPGVQWDSPQNLLIFASGPLNGTRIMGSGTFSVVTKGAMTNGATSSQASGFMGAYMKFSGFDAVVIEGVSDQWVYLYLHDGIAEFRDARYLIGNSVHETAEFIKQELGYTRGGISVFSIGPAGENLVRFAAIIGDGGHVVAHNGVGAVMGFKKLKAIAAARGSARRMEIHDPERLSYLCKEVFENIQVHPRSKINYMYGTSVWIAPYAKSGMLAVKNYTTNEIPENIDKFMGTYYRERFHVKPAPCWACRMHHCHILEVTDGPYTGYVGEEPEYEQWAGWGPQIGVTDPGAAVVLSNEADQLGIDANEGSWVIGLVMECYEKGILTKQDTDGLNMRWGNTEAVRLMLRKIAHREGIGNILAEGVKGTVEKMGGLAKEIGIYTLKGNTPRAHDDRANWIWMLDQCTSNTGVSETMGGANLSHPSYNLVAGPFDSIEVPKLLARRKGIVQFEDSLVLCILAAGPFLEPLAQLVGAVTKWDFSTEEALVVGLRIGNLLKAFNLRHGLTSELDSPSPRYGSSQSDGPIKAETVMPVWPQMLHSYYEELGWHFPSGKPLPETLKRLDLKHVVTDLWGNS